VEEATRRVNQVLGDDNQKRLASALEHLDSAATSASQLASRLDTTVAKRVDPALAQATSTLRTVQQSATQLGRTADEFTQTARRLNQPDGPIDRLAQGSAALSHAADAFNASTLPRINRVTEETSRAVRQLGRAANSIGERPQSLLYGTGPVPPGPGEPGFTPRGAGQ
jgi:phospholipid/cholesterol/gamma-HCH transport system substrate-binding protein